MTEADQIVRELAERNWLESLDPEQCAMCLGVVLSPGSSILDPQWHNPLCLWLRAKEYVSHIDKPHPGWKEGDAPRFGSDPADIDY